MAAPQGMRRIVVPHVSARPNLRCCVRHLGDHAGVQVPCSVADIVQRLRARWTIVVCTFCVCGCVCMHTYIYIHAYMYIYIYMFISFTYVCVWQPPPATPPHPSSDLLNSLFLPCLRPLGCTTRKLGLQEIPRILSKAREEQAPPKSNRHYYKKKKHNAKYTSPKQSPGLLKKHQINAMYKSRGLGVDVLHCIYSDPKALTG